MEHYFFHIRDGNTLLEDDEEGQTFPDFAAMRREAIKCARELLSEAALSGKAGRLQQIIEVTDSSSKIVFTIPVGHATGTKTQG